MWHVLTLCWCMWRVSIGTCQRLDYRWTSLCGERVYRQPWGCLPCILVLCVHNSSVVVSVIIVIDLVVVSSVLDLLPVRYRYVICSIFFCCISCCVRGCCFARHPALIQFELSSTTRILHDFHCMMFSDFSMMETKWFWERLSLFTKPPIDLYFPFVRNRNLSPSCTSFPSWSKLCVGSLLSVEDVIMSIALILYSISASLICSFCTSFNSDSILLFLFCISIHLKKCFKWTPQDIYSEPLRSRTQCHLLIS